MNSLTEQIQRTIDREYDYAFIYSHPETIKRIKDDSYDIKFIIGVKDRTDYFRTCLDNIVIAADKADLSVRIVIVEQDNEPINDKHCSTYNVDYIFIPQHLSKSETYHSTSLMYNIGYLFSGPAKWNMFHCCDTLISHNFFNILNEFYLSKPFNWIQPYCEKRVVTMNPSTTADFINNTNWCRFIDPATLPREAFNVHSEASGAPGGSILIPTELFDKVGGYEPELFYGYTIEDSFLWGKLEIVNSNGRQIPNIHQGGATYAEDPKLYLYHLNHPTASGTNARWGEMFNWFNNLFLNWTYEEQINYVDFRSSFFKTQKEKIIIQKHGERFYIHNSI